MLRKNTTIPDWKSISNFKRAIPSLGAHKVFTHKTKQNRREKELKEKENVSFL